MRRAHAYVAPRSCAGIEAHYYHVARLGYGIATPSVVGWWSNWYPPTRKLPWFDCQDCWTRSFAHLTPPSSHCPGRPRTTSNVASKTMKNQRIRCVKGKQTYGEWPGYEPCSLQLTLENAPCLVGLRHTSTTHYMHRANGEGWHTSMGAAAAAMHTAGYVWHQASQPAACMSVRLGARDTVVPPIDTLYYSVYLVDATHRQIKVMRRRRQHHHLHAICAFSNGRLSVDQCARDGVRSINRQYYELVVCTS